jgi:hypothetical protein
MLRHQHSGVSLMVNPGKYGAKILALIDGKKTFGEIFEQFRAAWQGKAAAPDNAVLFADFAESYDTPERAGPLAAQASLSRSHSREVDRNRQYRPQAREPHALSV